LPTYKAGIKVFFISQLGDIPLFIFAFLIINRFGTTDLSEILSQLFLVSFEYIILMNVNIIISFPSLAAFCLSFAVLLKAAQFFFYP
jgi:NADH:ubiquinone oxidoreductase subunit 5 (subunit L)/multisubunit Na+/H+ antiporter MnhA subunit